MRNIFARQSKFQRATFETIHIYIPHYISALEDERLTADEMDEQRKRNIAYEYLCHLEEAKM